MRQENLPTKGRVCDGRTRTKYGMSQDPRQADLNGGERETIPNSALATATLSLVSDSLMCNLSRGDVNQRRVRVCVACAGGLDAGSSGRYQRTYAAAATTAKQNRGGQGRTNGPENVRTGHRRDVREFKGSVEGGRGQRTGDKRQVTGMGEVVVVRPPGVVVETERTEDGRVGRCRC